MYPFIKRAVVDAVGHIFREPCLTSWFLMYSWSAHEEIILL